jgi:RyR domain
MITTIMKAMDKVELDKIARVCHEANRAYCESIGDHSQPQWDAAPSWQRESTFTTVKSHLDRFDAGRPIHPSESHEIWLQDKKKEGWHYGPVKDPDKKEHPCIVPYTELPLEQRMKDYLIVAVVEAYWKARKEG